MRTLIVGGVRSGKRRRALQLARPHGTNVVFLAPTRPDDEAARVRIERDRSDRRSGWTTVEVGTALGGALAAAAPSGCVVIEGLTRWLATLVCATAPAALEREIDALIEAVAGAPGDVVLVAEETGPEALPDDALARRFNDVAGTLHRRLAEVCERVEWTVAGLAVVLKPLRSGGVPR
jgi:adenosylcobinamide kinase/adenosylcobinamide-phosphate guanylyltransferase